MVYATLHCTVNTRLGAEPLKAKVTPPPLAAATVAVASHQAYSFGVLVVELALLALSVVTATVPNFNNPAAFTEKFE